MTALDLSDRDLPAQIQENLIAYMRLFAGFPGMVMEDGDVFWFISGKEAPGDNILRARWGESGIAQRIDQLYTSIGRHTSEMEWLLFPCDRPADLGLRLEARGMPPGRGGNWLWMDLEHLIQPPAAPAGFSIERVQDDRMMAEWVAGSEAGFNTPLPYFYEAYSRHSYGPQAFSLHYTGYLNGLAVTTGTLLDAGGTAAIYDLSTLPAYRRLGLGGNLSHHILEEIRRRGYRQTWIWSSNMAQSLYQKLGFVQADFGIRSYSWKKK